MAYAWGEDTLLVALAVVELSDAELARVAVLHDELRVGLRPAWVVRVVFVFERYVKEPLDVLGLQNRLYYFVFRPDVGSLRLDVDLKLASYKVSDL
eukprot:g38175.t1